MSWRATARSILLAYLVLTAALAAVGRLLRQRPPGLDEATSEWLAGHRFAALDEVTGAVSEWSSMWPIVIGALGTFLVLGAVGALRSAAALLVGLGLEIAVYVSVTGLVGRPRPEVDPLDPVAVTSSFPSGHVAAAIALYGGWAVVINRLARTCWPVRVMTVLAVVVPQAVAFSRIYRGQHHPTDVVAGAVLGVACLVVATTVTAPLDDRVGPA